MHRYEMSEIEDRLGIEPVESLIDQRRKLIDKVADLRARYGSFGTWEHTRKSELARISGLIRAQATRDQVKVTEAQIDQQAHAHDVYIALVTTATQERATLAKLEAEIEHIEWKVRRGEMVGRFVSAEARL